MLRGMIIPLYFVVIILLIIKSEGLGQTLSPPVWLTPSNQGRLAGSLNQFTPQLGRRAGELPQLADNPISYSDKERYFVSFIVEEII